MPYQRKFLLGALVAVGMAFVAGGCTTELPSGRSGGNVSTGGITLDTRDLFQGCSGPDCIPSIDNPRFLRVNEGHRVQDDDLIVGIIVAGQPYAYPYDILNWHEVVNQTGPSGEAFTVTYCPLTSSSVAFRRDGLPGAPEFGVSGLLWRSNLIVYDRGSNGLWSQMRLASVQGEHVGTQFDMIATFEMTWGVWRRVHPETLVLSRSTGSRRNYDVYPYLDYWTNNAFFIPQSFSRGDPAPPHYYDDRLDPKRRVHGVIAGGRAVAFRLGGGAEIGLHLDNTAVGGEPVLIVRGEFDPHRPEIEAAHSLQRTLDGQVLTFAVAEETEGGLPLYMVDSETGSRWTMTGVAVAGPLTGQRLPPTRSYNAFWFAWVGFWPETFLR